MASVVRASDPPLDGFSEGVDRVSVRLAERGEGRDRVGVRLAVLGRRDPDAGVRRTLRPRLKP